METFSAYRPFVRRIHTVTGEFPTQRPVTRSFDVFFDLRLSKRLGKQWWGWWFETPSRPSWRHSNGKGFFSVVIAERILVTMSRSHDFGSEYSNRCEICSRASRQHLYPVACQMRFEGFSVQSLTASTETSRDLTRNSSLSAKWIEDWISACYVSFCVDNISSIYRQNILCSESRDLQIDLD